MWAATAAGEFRFDGQGMTPFDQSRGIQSNDVRATTEDNEGRILIATSRGVSVIQGTRVSTLVMAGAEPRGTEDSNPREAVRDAAMPRPVTRGEATGGSDDALGEVTNIFASRDGKLWLATPRGVVLYDRKSVPTLVG